MKNTVDRSVSNRADPESRFWHAARLSEPNVCRLHEDEIGAECLARLEIAKSRVIVALEALRPDRSSCVAAFALVDDGELHVYAGPRRKVVSLVERVNPTMASRLRTADPRRGKCVVFVVDAVCFFMTYKGDAA